MIDNYLFTDIDTSDMTKKELKQYLANELLKKAESEIESCKSIEIGKIILSCVPLNESVYVPLDGRPLHKVCYPDLYQVYKNKYILDAKEAFNQETDFIVPDCYKRALIMQDKNGTLDKANRTVGTNLPWRFHLESLLDFDLEKQPEVIKNITFENESSKTQTNQFTLTNLGNSGYIMKKSKYYQLLGTDYSNTTDVRIANELKFNTRTVFFYTKCGRILEEHNH